MFIWCRWVNGGAPWARWVQPVSLISLESAVGVFVLIRVHLVHWAASWRWLGSACVTGFIGVCPGSRRVPLVSLG